VISPVFTSPFWQATVTAATRRTRPPSFADGEKLYATRLEAIPSICGALEKYLSSDSVESEEASRGD